MSVMIEERRAAGVPREDAERELERILQSRTFRNAAVLRSLLSYLASKCLTGEGDSLKEYSIGLDVLGKPASFDPRQESVVRMHTARLRQKLAEYYGSEGPDDPVSISLPKGGFKVAFEATGVHADTHESPPTEPTAPARTGWSVRELVLGAGLALALLIAVIALTRPWPRARSEADAGAPGWTPELRALWEPMISSGRRLVICMATPLFIEIPGFGAVRDSSVNDWDNVPASKRLGAIEDALSLGMSEPSYNYTDAGTATGAFLLGQFLSPRRQNVVVARATSLSWPEIAEDNVLFLGSPDGIHQVQDLPIREAQLVMESKGVRNLHPRTGEQAFFADRPGMDGEESGESYALISRLPAMNGHGAILMLAGNHAASVTGSVEAFTNPAVARTLVMRLRDRSGKIPAYFQVAVRVKSMDEVPVDISYVLHREIER